MAPETPGSNLLASLHSSVGAEASVVESTKLISISRLVVCLTSLFRVARAGQGAGHLETETTVLEARKGLYVAEHEEWVLPRKICCQLVARPSVCACLHRMIPWGAPRLGSVLSASFIQTCWPTRARPPLQVVPDNRNSPFHS